MVKIKTIIMKLTEQQFDKLLKDQGIKPAKKEQWNPAPNEILEDLFKTLGDIFNPKNQ